MQLEIVSPEAQLFSGEVSSVTVPGASGSFQILNNHAPIVSTLVEGALKFRVKLVWMNPTDQNLYRRESTPILIYSLERLS